MFIWMEGLAPLTTCVDERLSCDKKKLSGNYIKKGEKNDFYGGGINGGDERRRRPIAPRHFGAEIFFRPIGVALSPYVVTLLRKCGEKVRERSLRKENVLRRKRKEENGGERIENAGLEIEP